jgi:uncharacterized Fe-S center protein
MSYLRPNYAAVIIKLIQSLGGKPFLTDSNTLYSGGRSNTVDHLDAAMRNGYNPIAVPCNVIIADGLKGTDYREVPIEAEYCKSPKIGAAVIDADVIVSLNHFKGHEQAGFGGALKNLGMGAASVGGKLELHSGSHPVIAKENCTGCRICERYCAHDAIHVGADKIAVIDYDKCVGCGQCVALCQYSSAVQGSEVSSDILCCKIAEYAKAVVQGKPNFHVNFIMDVSPECDCWDHNDSPVVPSIGIAASFDPVALDQACADLINKSPVLPTGRIGIQHAHEDLSGKDRFKLIHPDTEWEAGLAHAEKIGLGCRKYELIKV